MKRYFNAMLIGLLIAGFLISISVAIYWHPIFISTALVQGALQGLGAAFIYQLKRPPYLFKVLMQMVLSWFLAFVLLWLNSSIFSINLWLFTLEWFVIWLIIFAYFYMNIHRTAEEINKKLRNKRDGKNNINDGGEEK